MLGYYVTARGYVAHFETYIFEWSCTVHSDIHVYLLIHCMWRYSKKDKSTIVLELRAKRARKLFENWTVAGEASRKFWGKLTPPPPPPPPLKESIYFLHKKRTDYFQHFEGQNIHFHKVPPPLSESNGRPLIAYAKCKYVTREKSEKQETRAMLPAGQCCQGFGRIQCDMQESTATSSACKWLMQRLPSFISFPINLIF